MKGRHLLSSRRAGIPAEELEQWKTVIPVQNCPQEKTESRVVVLVPRSTNRWFAAFLKLFNRNPWIRVRLDEKGALVWNLCDGNHTVQEICEQLEKKFGDQVKPSLERTALLLRQMYRYGMVKLYRS